jgi:mannitol/fructose-specific phosphotransferase system IIA component (Ntr-type)
MVGQQRMSLHFAQVLLPAHVDLRFEATELPDAVQQLLGKLAGDDRISDHAAFAKAVQERAFPLIEKDDFCLCLAHGRTNALRALTMAAGRPAQPLACPQSGRPIHLIIVAGIPAAFSTDYLRFVGAIARICGEPETRAQLLETTSSSEFVQTLDDGLNPV